MIFSTIGGFADENESTEFGESWFEDTDWDEEYDVDNGLLNIADLGGLLTPDENIKLAGLLLVVSATVVGEDSDEKYRDLAAVDCDESELDKDRLLISKWRLSVSLIGIETLGAEVEDEFCIPGMKVVKLETLPSIEVSDFMSMFPA